MIGRGWRKRRAQRREAAARAKQAWVKNGFSLNAKLRGDKVLLSEMPLEPGVDPDGLTRDIDAAMRPLRHRRELLRGVPDPEVMLGVDGDLEGHEFTDPGFVSTTTDSGTAEIFGSGATMRIDAAPGVPSLDLEDLNDQREVVLGRGLRHRITKDQEIEGRRVLDVEVSAPPRRRAQRSPWALICLAISALVAVVIVAIAGTIMAILGGNLACMGGSGLVLASPPTRAAVKGIPAERLRLYQQAGQRFDVEWTFLASIGYQECGHGACAHVYPSGCGGPMQIAIVRESACSPGSGPTIWERYRVDADGGGADPFDPADAIFTAARMMRPVFGLAGDTYAAYHQAACNYYGACGDSVADYASEVMARAVEYGFAAKGSPAPRNGAGAEAAPEGGGSGCVATTSGASGNEIVRIAESQLGRAESPIGSNCNPYGPCVEWCSLFVAWVWERAGVPLKGGTAPFAYSGTIYEWARDHEEGVLPGPAAPGDPPFLSPQPNGARVLPPTATPAPGDAVLYGSGPTESDHIGIVERVFPDGEITTIDGNFGNRVARSGPFLPSEAVRWGMPAPIFGYAHPPISEGGGGEDG